MIPSSRCTQWWVVEAQKQAAASASQMQALFDRYTEDERLRGVNEVGEMSVDLMTAPAQDEERQRLNARFKELEDERQQFTQAAVRLGKEKAALEVWSSEWMLSAQMLITPTLIGRASQIPRREAIVGGGQDACRPAANASAVRGADLHNASGWTIRSSIDASTFSSQISSED